jgi:hypothetical protein
VAKPDEAPRVRHGGNQCNYPKLVHSIGSEGGGPLENWNKKFGGPPQQTDSKTTSKVELRTMAEIEAEAHTHQDLYTACTMAMKPTISPKIASFTLTPKRKWINSWLILHNN